MYFESVSFEQDYIWDQAKQFLNRKMNEIARDDLVISQYQPSLAE